MNNFFKIINESTYYSHDGNADEIYDLGEINIIDNKKKEVIKVNSC